MDNKKISIYHQLANMYKMLICMEEDEISEVVEALKAINFKGILDYFVDMSIDEKLDDLDLMTCKKMVEILQFIYNNTSIETPVSDDDYDKLYQVMIDLGIGDIVGSVNSQGKPVREHNYPLMRGTLNKVHFMFNVDKKGDKRRSVEDWKNTIESIIGMRIYKDEMFEILCQPKWDGVSVVFENDKNGIPEHALLRGDTDKNLAVDIIKLFDGQIDFKQYVDANNKRKFAIKTEVLMNRASYEAICKEYKSFNSPRSATTSIVNEKVLQPQLTKYLDVKALRIQYEGSEPEVLINDEFDMYGNLYDPREIQYNITCINEKVREQGLSTDGVVLILVNKPLQKKLGRDGAINRFEVAYKFPAEAQRTKILDVDFSIGLGGNITPVAKIEPVIMKGNQIKSISLGSIERFISLNLRRGDNVIIRYEIIPYLENDPTNIVDESRDEFHIPTHCKYCGCRLEEDPMLKCINESCSSRIIGNVVNYINKMRIENISIETVTTFFDQGIITGIESLYSLEDHKNKIINLPGFGVKSYNKIIDGINAKMEVYDYELMGAIGIPDIAERTFKKILSVLDLNTVLTLSKEYMLIGNLMGLPGFGEKTATKVQTGINSKLKVIYFLLDTLTLKHKSTVNSTKGKICFTKVRDANFENNLVSKGYEVSDSLTKETKILIVPSLDVSSSKVDKAKKYGITIMTLDDAIRSL